MEVTFHGSAQPASREFDLSGERTRARWHIPTEMPVAFVFNRRNYSVMMATPDDLVDFAIGFSLTENVIKSPKDIISLDVIMSEQGADLRFKISDDCLERLDVTQRRRNMVGSASCGLCGLESADVLFRSLPKVSEVPVNPDIAIVTKAIASLRNHQPLNQLTRSVHAAAWVDKTGAIKFAREDVGRHNALDKLLGAIAQSDVDIGDGFVLMSSRCSYEIIEKAASQGVKMLVSVSAPTAFALRKAQEVNMAIFAKSGEGAVRLL